MKCEQLELFPLKEVKIEQTNEVSLRNSDCFDVLPKLSSESVDLVITDPPYNMTACSWDKSFDVKLWWSEIKRVCKKDATIVVFSKQPFTTLVNSSNLPMFKYELIWCKQQATNPMCAKKRIMPIHENISVFYDKLGTYNPQMTYGHKNYKGGFEENLRVGNVYYANKSYRKGCTDGSRYPTSVLYYNNVRNAVHPTQKPVDLLEFLVKTYSNEGDVVLDPFMGSGTTGVACKKCNRGFVGIEKNETFFDMAVERITKEYENESN